MTSEIQNLALRFIPAFKAIKISRKSKTLNEWILFKRLDLIYAVDVLSYLKYTSIDKQVIQYNINKILVSPGLPRIGRWHWFLESLMTVLDVCLSLTILDEEL